MNSSNKNVTIEYELAKKFLPCFMVDENEPFPIKSVGYTIYWESMTSKSFRRNIVLKENSKCLIEYSIYLTYDIEHLYDLEHTFVEINKNDQVIRVEGSYHGKYINEMLEGILKWEETHPVLYLQPGKHAVMPSPEYFHLYPELLECCVDTVGKEGLLVNDLFAGCFSTDDEFDKLVRDYMQRFSFVPSMKFKKSSAPFALMSFDDQKKYITQDILNEKERIKNSYEN